MGLKKGVLFGIGVGPGDPELITVKAVNVLKKADVIFTAASTKNSFSLAVDIAKDHIPEGAVVRQMSFPMTSNTEIAEKAWLENTRDIIDVLDQGKNAAFLTLGDPMTYSTFGYIVRMINSHFPDTFVESIPGITSYQAAASRVKTPLVEGEESLLITSGAFGGERIRKIAPGAENIVLLKAYKNIKDISKALEEVDCLKKSLAIRKCGREGEVIIDDIRKLEDEAPDYWTLIMAKRSGE